jgi:hypothetical protein
MSKCKISKRDRSRIRKRDIGENSWREAGYYGFQLMYKNLTLPWVNVQCSRKIYQVSASTEFINLTDGDNFDTFTNKKKKKSLNWGEGGRC